MEHEGVVLQTYEQLSVMLKLMAKSGEPKIDVPPISATDRFGQLHMLMWSYEKNPSSHHPGTVDSDMYHIIIYYFLTQITHSKN